MFSFPYPISEIFFFDFRFCFRIRFSGLGIFLWFRFPSRFLDKIWHIHFPKYQINVFQEKYIGVFVSGKRTRIRKREPWFRFFKTLLKGAVD